jgi:hypothetical protein
VSYLTHSLIHSLTHSFTLTHRRVLLYFTLRTKTFNLCSPKIPAGSLFDGMNMKVSDFMHL